ncbi:MAG: hypothetical protein GC134_01970 [Proteobacteria bacterium]|nr:hypothetical protein [Pseudomonadota bacterium]
MHRPVLKFGLAVLAALSAHNAVAVDLEVAAKAYVVGHPKSGRILMSKAADDRIEPASLTKLMTLYLTFEALKNGDMKLDDEIPVSEKAWRKGGSKMFIEVGKTVKVDDLIKGITVASGNDACVALAEHLAGSEEGFAALMNVKARNLGMTGSNFKNASGWPDPDHYTTPHDMYTLASRIQKDFPEFYHYFSIQSFTYNNITQSNRNGLLRRDPSVDGMKTGHTETAGYHLISSAEKNDDRIISVMMGTESEKARENESLKVMGWAFSQFDHYKALKVGETVDQSAPVWMGTKADVPLVAGDDVNLFLSRSEKGKLKAEVVYNAPLKAPIHQGEKVGEIRIETGLQDMPVVTVPALAAADVPELGFFGKAVMAIANKFGE